MTTIIGFNIVRFPFMRIIESRCESWYTNY